MQNLKSLILKEHLHHLLSLLKLPTKLTPHVSHLHPLMVSRLLYKPVISPTSIHSLVRVHKQYNFPNLKRRGLTKNSSVPMSSQTADGNAVLAPITTSKEGKTAIDARRTRIRTISLESQSTCTWVMMRELHSRLLRNWPKKVKRTVVNPKRVMRTPQHQMNSKASADQETGLATDVRTSTTHSETHATSVDSSRTRATITPWTSSQIPMTGTQWQFQISSINSSNTHNSTNNSHKCINNMGSSSSISISTNSQCLNSHNWIRSHRKYSNSNNSNSLEHYMRLDDSSQNL